MGCKKRQSWLWLALCRVTRQVVAAAVGPRTQATCRRLWAAIPPSYRVGRCYSDFLQQYRAVLPPDQHVAVGKDTGQTSAIERFNTTLRQRLGRLVRKTLSFSKSEQLLEACLFLFLWRYNLDQKHRWTERRQCAVNRFLPCRRRRSQRPIRGESITRM